MINDLIVYLNESLYNDGYSNVDDNDNDVVNEFAIGDNGDDVKVCYMDGTSKDYEQNHLLFVGSNSFIEQVINNKIEGEG